MHSPDSPSRHSKFSLPNEDLISFEQVFKEVESMLQAIKGRYVQLQTAKQSKAELQQRLDQLQTELHQVKEQLEALEIDLESRLPRSSYQEYFWQAIRFLGLGFVLGQLLDACSH